MAISNYSELKTAVENWLNRSDLDSRIPEFIALAEARIQRVLRRATVVDDIDLDSGEVTLPADVGEVRYLRHAGTIYQFPIDIVSPVVIADTLNRWAGVESLPKQAAVIEGVLHLAPVPDQTYPAKITYFEKLTPLSDAEPTNSVLTDAPDLYLAGAMVEALLYLEYEERIPMWEAKFAAAFAELEIARERAEFAAAPAPVRLPVVFD